MGRFQENQRGHLPPSPHREFFVDCLFSRDKSLAFSSQALRHFSGKFRSGLQVSSDFSSLLGIGKFFAQLETCQIISNVYTKVQEGVGRMGLR